MQLLIRNQRQLLPRQQLDHYTSWWLPLSWIVCVFFFLFWLSLFLPSDWSSVSQSEMYLLRSLVQRDGCGLPIDVNPPVSFSNNGRNSHLCNKTTTSCDFIGWEITLWLRYFALRWLVNPLTQAVTPIQTGSTSRDSMRGIVSLTKFICFAETGYLSLNLRSMVVYKPQKDTIQWQNPQCYISGSCWKCPQSFPVMVSRFCYEFTTSP